jgi:hypothetical protein
LITTILRVAILAAISAIPVAIFLLVASIYVLGAIGALYRGRVFVRALCTVLSPLGSRRSWFAPAVLFIANATAVARCLLRLRLQDAINQIFFAGLRIPAEAEATGYLFEFRKLFFLEFGNLHN